MTARTVRFGHYLAYGSNDFLGAGAMAVISGWILFFYTTFCGLTAVQAAAIFAIARMFDAVASPLIGYLSDHFHRTRAGRRFGRRRFFILLAVPLLPSFALMWIDGMTFWYYLATYVFFEVVYAMELIPYETLAAEMSPDYRVKAKFAGARILCGQVSAILAGVLPGRIIEAFGKDSAETFFYLGVIFSVIFMLVALAVFTFTWERPREEIESIASEQGDSSPLTRFKQLYRDLFATLRIRAFRLHLGMYLGGYISQDIFNAVFTYFVVFAMGSTVVMASNFMGTMAFAQLIAVAAFIPMCLRLHPAPSYRIAVSLYATAVLGFVTLYLLQPLPTWWIFVPVLIAGLGRGGLNYIPWNTYNYMADVDEIVTGRRREGAFAGVMTFIRKTSQAAAVMGVGMLLQAGGFVSGDTTQSSGAVRTILLVMTLGTLTLLAFGWVVSLRFRLDRNTHAVLMTEIRRFKEAPGAVPDAESRRIVEDLSGWPYEQLWGHATAVEPKGSVSVGKAIALGLLWVNGPVLVLLAGPLLLLALDNRVSAMIRSQGWLALTVLVGGFALAWLWWSFNVPKWRLWAYQRVVDIAKLKRAAVSAGITWPDGSAFARTEWKSPAHALKERELDTSLPTAE